MVPTCNQGFDVLRRVTSGYLFAYVDDLLVHGDLPSVEALLVETSADSEINSTLTIIAIVLAKEVVWRFACKKTWFYYEDFCLPQLAASLAICLSSFLHTL